MPPVSRNAKIASVKFNMLHDPLAAPSLCLGLNDTVRLSFDILSDRHDNLKAQILHFNSDWSPSELLPAEFNKGWDETLIEDFQYSAPVFTPYVNYQLLIPSPGLNPLVSGNYMVRIFPEDNPDSTLLQLPFDVSENAVGVDFTISTDTRAGFNSQWQEIQAVVSGSIPPPTDPFAHLWLIVERNNDPFTTRRIAHPQSSDNKSVIFANTPQMLFPAGNEFRRFDTLQTDHPGLNAESVRFENGIWHTFLTTDHARTDTQYVYDHTQHGEFVIDDFNSSDPDLGADYVMVHFSLDIEPVIHREIYVDGAFTLHSFSPLNRMTWNSTTNRYEASILLKQGIYNYQYVIIDPNHENMPDPSQIEGNLFQTQNSYRVKAFIRPPGSRYDRLIAVATR